MNILDTIIAHKKKEVSLRKKETPVHVLEQTAFFSRNTFSLVSFLADPRRTGIIAEFKRQSPSKGIINAAADIVSVTAAYAEAASGISVLTDTDFFGGSNDDLERARVNDVPILRKDFIIDEYQLVEAKAIGADLVLLIAACLDPRDVKRLATTARGLNLEVLLEVHDRSELDRYCDAVSLVGVNNRSLQTFAVDIYTSVELFHALPADKPAIAESGISDPAVIRQLREVGYRGFLVGENFMKAADPASSFRNFVQQLRQTENTGAHGE